MDDIKEALDEDFDKFYKGKVKERIENSVRDDLLMHNTDYIEYAPQELSVKLTFGQGLLEKVAKEHAFWNPTKNDLDVYSDEFNKFMYSELVDSTKSKNAMDYVTTTFGQDNSWVLKESAKNWESIERMTARREMWSSSGRVSSEFMPKAREHIQKHFTLATNHLPFDLVSDMLIKHGLTIRPPDIRNRRSPVFSYQPNGHYITIPDTCTTDEDFTSFSDPYSFHPKVPIRDKDLHITGYFKDSSFGSTIMHEFAHSIDHFLSGGKSNTMTHWNSKEALKYLGKHSNALFESYHKALINSSGGTAICTKHRPGLSGGAYFTHDDDFSQPYEGRIYGPTDSEGTPIGLQLISLAQDSKFIDSNWKNDVTAPPKGTMWGAEHWAESVSKYSAAAHHYFVYRQRTKGDPDSMSFVDWCADKAKQYREVSKSFSTKNDMEQTHPDIHSAYRYSVMEHKHGVLGDAIDHLLNRGDFLPRAGSIGERTRYTTKIGPNKKGQGRKANAPVIPTKTAKSLTLFIGGNNYESENTGY